MAVKQKVIEWELGEIVDRLSFDWAEYEVSGEDEAGIKYSGNCQTFVMQPEEELEVYGIEKLESDG